ncbi:hypothetical protein V6N13_060032 [Hibiscus sabdariffa]
MGGVLNHDYWDHFLCRFLHSFEVKQLSELRAILLHIDLVEGERDRLVWRHSVMGVFSVKRLPSLMYLFGIEDGQLGAFEAWKLDVPPKV